METDTLTNDKKEAVMGTGTKEQETAVSPS